jgi:signal transduction histidine kinase/CheY-like chemotaxis protein
VDDPRAEQETLARLRMSGSSGTVITACMLCVAAVLRLAWRIPVPITVFAAGLGLLAGDLWLSHVRSSGSPRDLDRVSLYHYLFDICAITFIIHQLGGADWLGALFYLFVILHANISLRRAHSLIVTAVCMIAFASSTMLAYRGLLPPAPLFAQRPNAIGDSAYAVTMVFAVGIGGLLMFSLTFGRFADVLRRKTDELLKANARLRKAAQRLERHRDDLEQAVELRTRELKTALDHLRSAHEELRRADQHKTSFLANVSHELRTPLTSIRSFAEILLKFPDEEPESRREFLEIIAAESDRLGRLIEDLLDIAKIDLGRLEWNFSSVELPALLSFCVRTITPLARDKGLALRLCVPPDLPPARADRDRIAQILNNLLANALKFTESGTITVGAAPDGNHVRIYVSDSGPGIPLDERDRVFEKFHQIGNADHSKPAGTGLGLAICAEIVASHGGRIWVTEAEGGGSTFQFTLPVDDLAEHRVDTEGKPAQRLVLITATEAEAARRHREALEAAGYAVREAREGQQMLRLAAVYRPHLICLDVLTPDMSGLDVLRALRSGKDTRDIPVIMMSVMEEREWSLQLGAAGHLVKPVSGAALVAAAEQVLAASDLKPDVALVEDAPEPGALTQERVGARDQARGPAGDAEC